MNPTAGKGRAARLAAGVTGQLRAAGVDVSVLIGSDATHALDLARDAVTRVDAVVALGGDGVVHLALQAVAGTPVPLGIVPAGTGNDFAASAGLPARDPDAATGFLVEALTRGEAVPTDAVRAAGRWYASVLGAGFDSLVNDRANRMRWPRGRMRYNLAILAELRVFRPVRFELEMDGRVSETDAMLVAVGNGRSYGAGMRVVPDARIDDGLLDVAVLGPLSTPEFLRTFPKVYRGTHVRHPAVTMHRVRTIRLAAPGVRAYADGELLAPLPVTCTCIPGAVRVFRPPSPPAPGP